MRVGVLSGSTPTRTMSTKHKDVEQLLPRRAPGAAIWSKPGLSWSSWARCSPELCPMLVEFGPKLVDVDGACPPVGRARLKSAQSLSIPNLAELGPKSAEIGESEPMWDVDKRASLTVRRPLELVCSGMREGCSPHSSPPDGPRERSMLSGALLIQFPAAVRQDRPTLAENWSSSAQSGLIMTTCGQIWPDLGRTRPTSGQFGSSSVAAARNFPKHALESIDSSFSSIFRASSRSPLGGVQSSGQWPEEGSLGDLLQVAELDDIQCHGLANLRADADVDRPRTPRSGVLRKSIARGAEHRVSKSEPVPQHMPEPSLHTLRAVVQGPARSTSLLRPRSKKVTTKLIPNCGRRPSWRLLPNRQPRRAVLALAERTSPAMSMPGWHSITCYCVPKL